MSPGYEFNFDGSTYIDADIVAAGMQTTVVPIVFRKGEYVLAEGTAFCISYLVSGEAVFVTAGHVIEQLVDDPSIEECLFEAAVSDDRQRCAG